MDLDKSLLLLFNNTVMTESTKGIGKIVVIVIVALIIAAAVGGYTMLQPKNATAPSVFPTPTQAITEETPTSTPGSEATTTTDAKERIVVEGSNFKFAPNKITLKKGQPVTIVFKNSGGIHDFNIDEFDVETKQIKGGASEEVTFTPDKTGAFEFYCSVGNHRALGMTGTLTVTE